MACISSLQTCAFGYHIVHEYFYFLLGFGSRSRAAQSAKETSSCTCTSGQAQADAERAEARGATTLVVQQILQPVERPKLWPFSCETVSINPSPLILPLKSCRAECCELTKWDLSAVCSRTRGSSKELRLSCLVCLEQRGQRLIRVFNVVI